MQTGAIITKEANDRIREVYKKIFGEESQVSGTKPDKDAVVVSTILFLTDHDRNFLQETNLVNLEKRFRITRDEFQEYRSKLDLNKHVNTKNLSSILLSRYLEKGIPDITPEFLLNMQRHTAKSGATSEKITPRVIASYLLHLAINET